MDWGDIWTWLLFAVIVIGVCTGVFFICAPHNLTGYYLDGGDHGLVCVYGHWTNKADESVYCSTSADQALEFLKEANQSLHPPKILLVPKDANDWLKDIPQTKSLPGEPQ